MLMLKEMTKTGVISVVGISYHNDLLTNSALKALGGADVVIGHKSFIGQVRPFLKTDASAYDILDEVSGDADFRDLRIQHAIRHAKDGKSVVLISSGDPGIWGMAAYLFPALSAQGFDRDGSIRVDVLPGITAAQVAASRLGAPLMNGFAFNALCDDITDPNVIDRRMNACAEGDMVTVVYKLRYNAEEHPEHYPIEKFPRFHPPVQRSRERFETMCGFFLKTRAPETPVVIARNLGDEDESLKTIALSELKAHFAEVNLTSILLIGNSETRVEGGWLVSNR